MAKITSKSLMNERKIRRLDLRNIKLQGINWYIWSCFHTFVSQFFPSLPAPSWIFCEPFFDNKYEGSGKAKKEIFLRNEFRGEVRFLQLSSQDSSKPVNPSISFFCFADLTTFSKALFCFGVSQCLSNCCFKFFMKELQTVQYAVFILFSLALYLGCSHSLKLSMCMQEFENWRGGRFAFIFLPLAFVYFLPSCVF